MSEFGNQRSANNVDLSDFDEDFDSVESTSFDEVADGKYQVQIDSVKLAESQKGDPMIKWDLLVLSGPNSGRHIFKNSVITQASLPFVKSDLKTLGLQLAKFSDLTNRLEELLDMTLEITKRTKGDYTNVYFNRKVELAGPITSGVPDEVPF